MFSGFFFFQAEDGIRDGRVTGVQTCALPISSLADAILWKDNHWALLNGNGRSLRDALRNAPDNLPVIVEVESDEQVEAALAAGVTHLLVDNQPPDQLAAWVRRAGRSEERRVGKEGRSR